jgi:CRISPR/Cas system Type II protein with McrA/HNH and RuvC-like nuclease domain
MSPVCELQQLQDLLDPKEAKRRFKLNIFNQWHHKCCYCERYADTLDHIKPKRNGLDDSINNLVSCCYRCNQSKGSKEMLYWWKQQYYWSEDRYNILMFWVENGFNPIDHSGDLVEPTYLPTRDEAIAA